LGSVYAASGQLPRWTGEVGASARARASEVAAASSSAWAEAGTTRAGDLTSRQEPTRLRASIAGRNRSRRLAHSETGERNSGRVMSWLFTLPNGSALSCEPQRLRGTPEAPKCRCQTLPEADWNTLWLGSCSALLGGARVYCELRPANSLAARTKPPLSDSASL